MTTIAKTAMVLLMAAGISALACAGECAAAGACCAGAELPKPDKPLNSYCIGGKGILISRLSDPLHSPLLP